MQVDGDQSTVAGDVVIDQVRSRPEGADEGLVERLQLVPPDDAPPRRAVGLNVRMDDFSQR
jgi:hypothetical protein